MAQGWIDELFPFIFFVNLLADFKGGQQAAADDQVKAQVQVGPVDGLAQEKRGAAKDGDCARVGRRVAQRNEIQQILRSGRKEASVSGRR